MKKIIITGKGGVGKTTIIATLSRLLARDGHRVLVIDCDPSMNLAMSLGVSLSDVLPLAENKADIHERLGLGMEMDDEQEHLTNGNEHEIVIDEVIEDYIVKTQDGVKLIVMGTIPYGGSGCLCSSIALVKLLIGYITSGDNDFVMVDSQAGVEIFGRGLASEFDFTLVITEPMPKAIEVTRHVMKLSRDLGVKKQIVIVNKVEDEDGTECETISRELNYNADQMYSVRYDRNVIEADKKGILILDYAPQASVVEDIQRIKEEILGG